MKRSLFFFEARKQAKRRYGFFITPAGRWFFAFTALVSFLTLTGENNVLFLLMSFLVAAILLSSIFSDFALYRLSVKRRIHDAYAGETCLDTWILTNRTWFPLFAIELGEYDAKHYQCFAKLSYLGPKSTREIFSTQAHDKKRGHHNWQSIYAASAAPFGFTKKYYHCGGSGSRVIWPERNSGFLISSLNHDESDSPSSHHGRGFPERMDGEIRQFSAQDDFRELLALRSGLDPDQWVTRVRQAPEQPRILVLDLGEANSEKRALAASLLEKRISALSAEISQVSQFELRLIQDSRIVASYSRKHEALDALALILNSNKEAGNPKQKTSETIIANSLFLKVGEIAALLGLLSTGHVSTMVVAFIFLCVLTRVMLNRKGAQGLPESFLAPLNILLFPIGYLIYQKTSWHPVVVAGHLAGIAHALLFLQRQTPRVHNFRAAFSFVDAMLAASLSPELHTGLLTLAVVLCVTLDRFANSVESGLKRQVPKHWYLSVSILLVAIGSILFPLLPRPRNFGALSRGSNLGQVGFATDVKLQSVQGWQDNDSRVALRLFLPEGDPKRYLPDGLIRIRTLELFDGVSWMARRSANEGPAEAPLEDLIGPHIDIIREPVAKPLLAAPYGTQFIEEIEGLSARSLAKAPQPTPSAFDPRLRRDPNTSDFELLDSRDRRLKYKVRLFATPIQAAVVGDSSPLHLIVPPRYAKDAELLHLSDSLALNKISPRDAVQKLKKHFSLGGYKWALQSHPTPLKGLELTKNFLFHSKTGHCEYYASASALLLRMAGIPARLVTGYRLHLIAGPAQVARENDAHAWVEFWDAGVWRVLDTTPMSLESSRLAFVRDTWMSIQNRITGFWYLKIVSYDPIQEQPEGLFLPAWKMQKNWARSKGERSQSLAQWFGQLVAKIKNQGMGYEILAIGILCIGLSILLVLFFRFFNGQRSVYSDLEPKKLDRHLARQRREVQKLLTASGYRSVDSLLGALSPHQVHKELVGNLESYQRCRYGSGPKGFEMSAQRALKLIKDQTPALIRV